MAQVLLNELRHAIDNYKFTITSKNDSQLLRLKQLVSSHNKRVRSMARRFNSYNSDQLLRVSLMARGKRRDKYGRRLHSNCDSNLQHKYASRFDVYIHKDSTGNRELTEEITTGLSTGQQRKIRATEFARLKQEWQDDDELRRNGIYYHRINNEKVYMPYDKYVAHARAMHPNMTEATFNRIFCN
jgi:hypothetical protein